MCVSVPVLILDGSFDIVTQVEQLSNLDPSSFIQVLGEFGPQNAAVALQVRGNSL
jgi:hypothetical protein